MNSQINSTHGNFQQANLDNSMKIVSGGTFTSNFSRVQEVHIKELEESTCLPEGILKLGLGTAALAATMTVLPANAEFQLGGEPSSFSLVSLQMPTVYQILSSNTLPEEYSGLYKQTERELLDYLALDEDWDGYGGVVPDEAVVQTCINFLHLLNVKGIAPPRPMLDGQGEVSLFWRRDESYFEIGFEEEGLFSYFSRHNGIISGDDDIEPGSMPEILVAGLIDYTKEME